jgi:trk system potassium uptake protein TrkH
MIEAALLLPSFIIGLVTREGDALAFGITIVLTAVIGFILSRTQSNKSISIKDGLAITTLSWIFMSLFGALPLHLTKSTPTYVNAVFEIISGFTTTGATVIADVEALTHGILFWRSFTHWIGGMGILVFSLAILPAIGVGGYQLFKAESPGPIVGKIVPRLKDTAKGLYGIYIGITILNIIFLKIGGMSWFDSFVYTFGTVGTGGFSTKNISVAAYPSSYIHIVLAIFMTLSAVNFSNYHLLLKGKVKEVFLDGELRLYITVLFIGVVLIAIDLLCTTYQNVGLAFRDSFFQASSIMTTSGYSTVDFNLWSPFSKMILVALMFVGGSAGSTAGGFKVIRLLILFKMIKREMMKTFHPRAVVPIKIGGKVVTDDTITSIFSYTSFYIIIVIFSFILISLEGVDFESSISSVMTTFNNVGPGLGVVGPLRNFGEYSQWSIGYFSFLMLLGRLEIFTMLALFSPRIWKNKA